MAYHTMATLQKKKANNVTRKMALNIYDGCFAKNWQL